ncbi:MAG: LamG-like jellyroll fold domain-containing protein [Verrucomicrobiota bacterium]
MKTWSSFLFKRLEYFRGVLLTLVWFYVGTGCVLAAGVAGISDSVLIQIQTLQGEKASRSPVEQKMDSQLVFAVKKGRDRALANAVPNLQPVVRYEPDGRVLVDIDAAVTITLLKQIEQRGGTVINSFAGFRSIRALLPLDQIQVVSASPDVKFVRPAVQAYTNTGTVNSEGDNTHGAATARSSFSVDGTGVKVGVLSDSVDFLSSSQANGNLGPVTVLSGQSGVPGSGEGTAMLEIIHDLAPGAQLFYATAFNGVASFAQNILDLRAAGCDIIVDDVGYFNESPFQDGPISQAVNTVTAGGALYFSAAANSGNKNDNTSGTWEGDFVDAGAAPAPVNGRNGRIHSFGASTQNTINQAGFGVVLFWSDPLGGSANDYDLYIVDSAGTALVAFSSNVQNGNQDPYEQVGQPRAGQKVVIVKATGTARYLHVDTLRGNFSINTAGNTKGHSAAVSAFSVAAVNASTSYPNPFVGGAQNPIETFSSDGPRRVFYQADGTAITPGNFSSTGGTVRQKPDIAAADGVSTSVPGFGSFFGTSAAAPHAAAVSALLLSYNSALTTAQVRSLLTSTALDIEAPNVDRDSGAGIVMASRAIQAAPTPSPNLVFQSSAISGGNGNNHVDPNECNQLLVTIRNAIGSSGGSATGVSAILSTTTPGVTIAQPSSAYPDVPAGGTAASVTPFQISTAAGSACGTVVDLVLSVTTANAGNFTIPFQLSSGTAGSPILFNSADVPKAIPDVSTVDSLVTVTGVTAAVARVTVTLYLAHTYDSDLSISLVGPDNTSVLLSSGIGASGDNYGASCSARTIFDDLAATPIGAGSAPFAGTFRPQQTLALFNGKIGNAVNGTWRLRVSDTAAVDVGTIQCWSINISPLTCTDGGGPCGQPKRALTVSSSNPNSGVSIAVSPNDDNGQGNGVSQFTRTYDINAVINLTAPATAGGNNFQKWQQDGVDGATTLANSVTMDANHTMTAVYIPPTGSGLVGYWKLDDAFGTTATDSSGSGNPGTLNNGPLWTSGKTGSALSFDGVDDYVNVNNTSSLNPGTQLTLSAWIKPTSTSTSGEIISKENNVNNQYYLRLQGGGKIRFTVAGATLNGTTTLSPNTWNLITGTYDGSSMNLYINGFLDATSPATLSMADNGLNVRLGARQYATPVVFHGLIDDVRIYNRALSLAEVQTLLNLSPPVNQPPSVDAGTDQTVTLPAGANLSGTATDDGLPNPPGTLTTTWSRFSGPGTMTFANPAALTTTASFSTIGTYVLRLTAADGALSSTDDVTITVNPPSNQPPTVGLSSPSSGALFIEPANITLTATANDPDGTVSKVEFFESATLLSTALTSPYTIPWNNVLSGSYTLRAKATDNANATATSSPANIVVDRAPTVSITSPGDGAIFAAPANIVIDATAGDADGSVTRVEFFNGAALLGTDTTSSYSFTWNNVGSGNYLITAKATDNLGVATTSAAVHVAVNDSSLVGYWKFDDGGGLVAADSSGNANHGTLVNGPRWTAGQNSGALSFDGVDDYVNVNNTGSLNPATQITLSVWIKPASTAASGEIISKENNVNNQYYMRLQGGGKIRFTVAGIILNGTTTLNPNTWYLATGTYDGSLMKVYLNGALEATAAATLSMTDNGLGVRLGARQYATPLVFHGLIDEARIYNRALSQAEIQALLNAGPSTASGGGAF